jgi:hypothetical protein
MPVTPPRVNKNMKPITHNNSALINNQFPLKVASQLKTLIPVGTAITIVAAVK